MPAIQKFGIFAPVMGTVENFPSILIDKAFSPKNENVTMHHGEISRSKGRLAEFVEDVYSTGAVCASNDSATVIVIGASIYSASTHKPAWGSDDLVVATGRAISIDGTAYTLKAIDSNTQVTLDSAHSGDAGNIFAIVAVNQGAKKFSVLGNQTAHYTADDKVAVNSSTGNDGTYTIASATWNDPNTDIVVDESIDDGTVDGNITDKGVSYTIGTADTKVPMPDGNPALAIYRFLRGTTGIEYIFGFTKRNVYLWSGVSWTAWMLKFGLSGSDCTLWDVVDFNDYLIATNNVDKVLYWPKSDTLTNLLDELDSDGNGIEYSTGKYLTKAKYLTIYENYIVVGATTEDGTFYPHRIRWSDLSPDPDGTGDWKTADAGAVSIQGNGVLGGFGHYKNWLILFKEKSIAHTWLTMTSDIFQIAMISDHIGCEAPHSIVNDKAGMLYFLASDYMFRDIELNSISDRIDTSVKNLKASLISGIESCHFDEFGDICWSVPHGAAATENNLLLKYRSGIWTRDVLAISSFGKYARATSWTIDTAPFNIDDMPGAIDDVQSQAGFMLDLGSNYSGNVFALHSSHLDDGSAFTGKFELSLDMANKSALPFFKRILFLDVYVRNQTSGSMTFQVKRDNEKIFQSVGSITLSGDETILVKRIACDYRAKHHTLEGSGANPFDFIGVVVNYIPHGDR